MIVDSCMCIEDRDKVFKHLLSVNDDNQDSLLELLSEDELHEFNRFVSEIEVGMGRERAITEYGDLYNLYAKRVYRRESDGVRDEVLLEFCKQDNRRIKMVWGDCLDYLKRMPSESVQLMVTSPPYYNAREYSQWDDLTSYLIDMTSIIKEAYRVLDNHRAFVFNIGDIVGNDNLVTRSTWGRRRLPLGAYFINIFEKCGFRFVDDIIWDKGEVQTQRHKNGNRPYPFYQYPANCYEHILIFAKHRLNKLKYPCPICGSLNVSSNSQSEIGVQSWECRNSGCFVRSLNNRGKRFSLKSNMIQGVERRVFSFIHAEDRSEWRRDIVKFSPVIKVGKGGVNRVGHSAPFPDKIPDMAVKFFSHKGDLVLDPFAGSFTSAVVANDLGRIGIGCEIRPDLFRESAVNKAKSWVCDYEEMTL